MEVLIFLNIIFHRYTLLVKTYKNDSQYYATFIGSSGNLLNNTPVKFNINGVFYTRTTVNTYILL